MELDFQSCCPFCNFDQAIDVGMRAGAVLGILCMFSKHQKRMGCGLLVKRAKYLLQVLIYCQRALLAGLVFNRGYNAALRVNQVDAGKAFDRRKQLLGFL